MTVPTRPADNAPVDTAWGDVVHDTIVANDVQSGVINMVFAASAVGPTVVVTFPRPFASVPIVVATAGGVSAGGTNVNVGITALTTTTVSLQGREVRETAISVTLPCQWIAIGPRA
jgi:hypothetical protein